MASAPIGNRELADTTGIPKATVSRLTATLVSAGYLRQSQDSERFSLGPALLDMHHIVLDADQRIGFVTLKPEGTDALRLDHLYLRTGFQGLGIGEWVLEWAKSQAREQRLDIKLTALVKSDANRFYLRHGFVLEGGEGVDLHYRWRVASEAAC